MTTRPWLFALPMLIGASSGCGDDGTGPSADDVTGTWQATKVEYVRQSPPQTFDLIAAGGSVTLVLDADHTYTHTQTDPGSTTPEVTTGTWQLDGEVMTVTQDGLSFSWQFDAVLSGGTLTLTGADAEFDFDGDDVPEAATMNLAFTR